VVDAAPLKGYPTAISLPMSRRRSGLQPAHFIGAAAILALAAGGYWFLSRDRTEKMQEPPFPVNEFPTIYTGMRGNSYVITGTIDKQLAYAADRSRMFSVKSNGRPVGVLVPPEITDDIQVGQEFQMLVLVERDTMPRVQKLRKS
jgi:hypothetical protein